MTAVTAAVTAAVPSAVTAPAPPGATAIRATQAACRTVVEVVVPILHDTLDACVEAADAHLDDRIAHLRIDDIPGLAARLAAQDAAIAAARAETVLHALLFG